MRYAHLVAAVALLLPSAGCDQSRGAAEPRAREPAPRHRSLNPEQAQALAARLCSSPGTYERLKVAAFRQAARVRGTDSGPFDRLAAFANIRIEEPLVVSSERGPHLVRCTARMALDLPPDTVAMSGARTLSSDIAFAGQEAADGSGLVWVLSSAEPIIYPLATLRRVSGEEFLPPPVVSAAAPALPAEVTPKPAVQNTPTPSPVPKPAPVAAPAIPAKSEAVSAPTPRPAPLVRKTPPIRKTKAKKAAEKTASRSPHVHHLVEHRRTRSDGALRKHATPRRSTAAFQVSSAKPRPVRHAVATVPVPRLPRVQHHPRYDADGNDWLAPHRAPPLRQPKPRADDDSYNGRY